MKSRSRKRGFTLVELLVVISIIALLLAIIIPSMNKARETARRVICSNQQKEIARAIAIYADAYDQKLPFYGGKDPSFVDPFRRNPDPFKCTESPTCTDSDCCPSDESHPYAVARGDKEPWYRMVKGQIDAIPLKLGCLYKTGVITDARIFYCPSTTEEQYKYASYVKPSPPNPSLEWDTLPQKFNADNFMNQWVRVGYTWFPVPTEGSMRKLFKDDLRAPVATARRFDKLESRVPMLADVLWFRSTMAHKTKDSYATNAAFKDTHVVYTNDWRLFTLDPLVDPMRLWERWEPRQIKFNYFYYNFFKKIQP